MAIVATLCICFSTANAQTTATEQRGNAKGGPANAGNLDDRTSGNSIRASQLMGMNIQNGKGESVGEIKDIVLDAKSGRVQYAAVTYGGLLGVGNKLFAVPFNAFKVQRDPDDRDDYLMVLDVTQERLDGATGFDEDTWPNFGDKSFTSQLNKRYGVDRKMGNRNRDGNVKRDRQ